MCVVQLDSRIESLAARQRQRQGQPAVERPTSRPWEAGYAQGAALEHHLSLHAPCTMQSMLVPCVCCAR